MCLVPHTCVLMSEAGNSNAVARPGAPGVALGSFLLVVRVEPKEGEKIKVPAPGSEQAMSQSTAGFNTSF